MQFYADALNENTLNISGNSGKSVALTADGTTYTAKNESADTKGKDSAYTRGFHLAGVDIPYPTGDYVQKTGTTSLSDTAALCWVQRCTTEGKVAWVLSLVNGVDRNNPDDRCPKTSVSCGGSEEEPEGNCSDASYKLTHKSECCPSAAKTDSACYSVILKWKNTTKSRTNGGDDCPRSGTAGPSSFECSKTGDTCELERCAGGDRQCVSLIFECSPSGEYKQLW